MVLVRTYVIPHGDEILSFPNDESRKMNEEITKGTRGDDSDTVLLISPHFLKITTGLPVINTQYVSGQYKIENKTIRGSYESDRELNSLLFKASKYFVKTSFVMSEGKLSTFPIDFGSLIPLKFFGKKKVSLLGQWRTSNKKVLIDLGKKLFDAVSKYEGSVSVVFSEDQAHCHSKKGPYGFDPRSKKYDSMIVDAIKKNNFKRLIDLDDEFIEGAKPDSYWETLMFHGFAERGNLTPKFHYYYLQQYFGMLFATATAQ